jgi:hypothetical protein
MTIRFFLSFADKMVSHKCSKPRNRKMLRIFLCAFEPLWLNLVLQKTEFQLFKILVISSLSKTVNVIASVSTTLRYDQYNLTAFKLFRAQIKMSPEKIGGLNYINQTSLPENQAILFFITVFAGNCKTVTSFFSAAC